MAYLFNLSVLGNKLMANLMTRVKKLTVTYASVYKIKVWMVNKKCADQLGMPYIL